MLPNFVWPSECWYNKYNDSNADLNEKYPELMKEAKEAEAEAEEAMELAQEMANEARKLKLRLVIAKKAMTEGDNLKDCAKCGKSVVGQVIDCEECEEPFCVDCVEEFCKHCEAPICPCCNEGVCGH